VPQVGGHSRVRARRGCLLQVVEVRSIMISGMVKRYGERTAVDGLSLTAGRLAPAF